MSRYLTHGGRIHTWSLEAHPVDHCNLSCEHCCQLSPGAPEAFVEPESLASDLARLTPLLAPRVLKLTGGEPLLHPRIAELASIARASNIARAVQITTNGVLFAKAPDALLAAVDRVKVSWYTSAPLAEAVIDRIAARCREHGVELEIREHARFQRLDPPELVRDEAWAVRAFAGCWIRDRCHTVHRGRFYTCSRPPHLGPHLAARGVPNRLAGDDGVALDDPDLQSRLQAYLSRDEPLASCRSCLGNEGEWTAHAQRPPHRRLPIA